MTCSTRSRGLFPAATPTAREPVYFIRAGHLYRLRVWTEREWTDIPTGGKPEADFWPGLGWVGGDLVGDKPGAPPLAP